MHLILVYIQDISGWYKNDGYSTDCSPVGVHVESDKDDVNITNQNGWNVERQQVILYS